VNGRLSVDSFYVIGHGHRVCQDYACHGNVTWVKEDGEEVSYWCAVLSDGCSSSPHSDIGARLLSHSFLQAVSEEGMSKETGYLALWTAHDVRKELGLPESALDATLLAVVTDGETVWGVCHGDGLVCMDTHRNLVSYPSGAPMYLNYRTNQVREMRFREEFGVCKEERSWWSPGVHPSPVVLNPASLYSEKVPTVIGTHIFAVISDGITSFSIQNEPVQTIQAAERLLAFKTYNGEFVTRRAMRFLQDTAKDGWKHFDDLSMAVLAIQVES